MLTTPAYSKKTTNPVPDGQPGPSWIRTLQMLYGPWQIWASRLMCSFQRSANAFRICLFTAFQLLGPSEMGIVRRCPGWQQYKVLTFARVLGFIQDTSIFRKNGEASLWLGNPGSELCEHSLGSSPSRSGLGFTWLCQSNCNAGVELLLRLGRAKSINICLGFGSSGSKDLFPAIAESLNIWFGRAQEIFIWKFVCFCMDLWLAGCWDASNSFAGTCDK